MMAAIAAVDTNPGDGDTVILPANVALLGVVYAGGDPTLVSGPFDPNDFGSLRWVGGNTSVTTEASAWTIVKELEWAKQFHVDDHFGTPESNFGAQQRFVGTVMALEAKMQLMAWLEDPARYDSSPEGESAMLIALADAADVFGATSLPHSASNRYLDHAAAEMFAAAAARQFEALERSHPRGSAELSIGIQGVVWYAAAASNSEAKSEALELVDEWGGRLSRTRVDTAADRAAKIRGLIEAGRVTQNDRYLRVAAGEFGALSRGYNPRNGTFRTQRTYTADDFGAIMGAINASRIFLGTSIDQRRAEEMFTGFFEGVANVGGLQISAPPVELFKAPFEQEEPPLFLRYPDTPVPPLAGGEYGIAPVLAASARLRNGKWTVDQSFDTAGAMHTANEMIWFHNDEVNGFPTP